MGESSQEASEPYFPLDMGKTIFQQRNFLSPLALLSYRHIDIIYYRVDSQKKFNNKEFFLEKEGSGGSAQIK